MTYVPMSDPRYDEINDAIRKTYKNACILWVEECHNQYLNELYEQYISSLKEPNIKRLFHGTSEQIARKIMREGFDPNYNISSSHGKGVYFSKRAVYSRNYCKISKDKLAFLFICDVALGKVGLGVSNQSIPKEYNSVTDNLIKPDMYIIDKKESAVPRFLVAFYPSAK